MDILDGSHKLTASPRLCLGIPVVSRIDLRRTLSWEDDTLFLFCFCIFAFVLSFLGSFASDCQPDGWPSGDIVLLIVCEFI